MISSIHRLAWLVPCLAVLALAGANNPSSLDGNLIRNSDFREKDYDKPADYTLSGDVKYLNLCDPAREMSAGWGVAINSGGYQGSGSVSQTVKNIEAKDGRDFRFTFRGLPQTNFAVEEGGLWAKVEFFANQGKTAVDGKIKRLDGIVELARKKLTVNGDRHIGGAAVWQTYQFDFHLPFPHVDQVRLSLGVDHGSAHAETYSSFLTTDWNLKRIDVAQTAAGPSQTPTTAPNTSGPPVGTLMPLGGRWYYLAKDGETRAASHFDFQNADHLIYHDDRWSAPFAGEMTSWLRAGEKDIDGNVATVDRFIPDNVTIDIDQTSLIIHSRGLPNHPTGRFPQSDNGRRGNPNFIQEQQSTYYIPLDPKVNARHFVTTTNNSNHALPMGPIGIAMNGIVFFNPFDMGNSDASNMMDFCCGHPNQDGQYHYHKYPICINSPWADEGTAHSPVIGWAFDGFPVYGPYETVGVLAKDVTGDQALNAFNLHWDKDRGWHYHVTPGQFPYIIGGYWGTEDARDSQRPHHPRGGGMAGGPPDGGPTGGPPGDPSGGRPDGLGDFGNGLPPP